MKARTLVCGHSYCHKCLSDFINGRVEREQPVDCPDCRTKIDRSILSIPNRNIILDFMVLVAIENGDEERKRYDVIKPSTCSNYVLEIGRTVNKIIMNGMERNNNRYFCPCALLI